MRVQIKRKGKRRWDRIHRDPERNVWFTPSRTVGTAIIRKEVRNTWLHTK